jgi:hypothetical protein
MDETSFPESIEVVDIRRLVPNERQTFRERIRVGRLDRVQPGALLFRRFDKDNYTHFRIGRPPAQNREAAEDLRMRRILRIAQEFRG